MDQKSLLGHVPHSQPLPPSRNRRNILISGCLATLSFLTLLRWIPLTSSCSRGVGQHSYAGEKISWTPCGDVSGRPVECARLEVPMDQFNASNSGDKTFNLSLIRMRGENATQNLLLNPGGMSFRLRGVLLGEGSLQPVDTGIHHECRYYMYILS